MVRIALSFLIVATLGSAASAQPKPPKAKPACGINWLPMVEGREWTYVATQDPNATPISDELAATLDKAQKTAPKQVATVVIKVLKVAETPAGAEITLEEKAGELVIQTSLHCTKDKMEISPQSFLFAGEPGGGLLTRLDKVTYEGLGFPGVAGFPRKFKNKLTVKADVIREPSPKTGAVLAPGRMELEIDLENLGPDQAFTQDTKVNVRGDRIQFDISGRAAVAPQLDKTFEMPLGIKGRFWYGNGVGLILVQNRLGHWYQLATPPRQL
jgi:hypothetical protein